jgi:hypothetical protein
MLTEATRLSRIRKTGATGLGFTIALTPIQTRRVQLARDAVHVICMIESAPT